MFDHVTILVTVNPGKRPTNGAERAADIRTALPEDWTNVAVAAWSGLTVAYCQQHGADAIIRGVRNTSDVERECQLAAMNEALGVTTVLLAARAKLAAISSTMVRSVVR